MSKSSQIDKHNLAYQDRNRVSHATYFNMPVIDRLPFYLSTIREQALIINFVVNKTIWLDETITMVFFLFSITYIGSIFTNH
jgi:hypothetical protein